MREQLTSEKPDSRNLAIHGLGGMGKTQVVVEYAYRHSEEYPIVWWVRAEEPSILASDYASLAEM